MIAVESQAPFTTRLPVYLRVSSYLLAGCGLLSVTLTEEFGWPWTLVLMGAVVMSWFYDEAGERRALYGRIWPITSAIYLVVLIIDLSVSANWFMAVVHMTLFAQVYLLFNKKTLRSYAEIYLVSFLHLLAASLITADVVFAGLFLCYLVLVVITGMLFHLSREVTPSRHMTLSCSGTGSGPHFPVAIRRSFFLTASAVALSMLLLTLTNFYLWPRAGAQYFGVYGLQRLNQSAQVPARRPSITGFARTINLGAYGRIQQDPTVVMRIKLSEGRATPGSLLWRGGCLELYEGNSWRRQSNVHFTYFDGHNLSRSRNRGWLNPANENGLFRLVPGLETYSTMADFDKDMSLLRQDVSWELTDADVLFAAYRPVAVFTDTSILVVYPSEMLRFGRRVLGRTRYTVYSAVGRPSDEALAEVPDVHPPSGFADMYLQLPDTLDPKVRQFARDIAGHLQGPFAKVEAVQEHLSANYQYTLDPPQRNRPMLLGDFLFDVKAGHCEYFATSMAILLRCLGVPTRLVNGFQTGQWNQFEEAYIVRQMDAHAWVEVFYPDYGWVPYDPSPRAHVDELLRKRRPFLFRSADKLVLSLQFRWREYVLGYGQGDQLRLVGVVRSQMSNTLNFLQRAVVKARERLMKVHTSGLPRGLLVAGVLLFTSAFAAATVALLKSGSLRRKNPVLRTVRRSLPRGKDLRFYWEMLKILARKDEVRAPGQTPREFAAQVVASKGKDFACVKQITELYYRRRYGREEIAHEETKQVKFILAKLRRA